MQISATMVKELRERTGAGMMDCKRALVQADGDLDAAAEDMRKSGHAKADKKAGRIAAEGVIAIHVDDSGRCGAMVEVNCETDFVAKEDEFRSFAAQVAARLLAQRPADASALAALTLNPGDGQTVDDRRRELVARIGENINVRRWVLVENDSGPLGCYLHGTRIGVIAALAGGDAVMAKDIAMHVAASRPVSISRDDLPEGLLDKEREILKAQVADSGKPPEIKEKMVAGRVQKYLKEVTLLGQPFVKDPDRSVDKVLQESGSSVTSFQRFEVGEGIEKRTENFAAEVMAQVRGS